MSFPILATKLYIPPTPPQAITRPRLLERLDEGLSLGHKLSLISAPAGFGKSTLASAWIANCGRPAAWLSLEAGDQEPVRFLSYLIRALQTLTPDLGARLLDMLDASGLTSLEPLLTSLLNEISLVPRPFVLVLDDYHVIEAKVVDEMLTFLLEHLPPQMHLAITTREDPAAPLPRLRARGQLTELRAADLRFTSSEAAEFLNKTMNLQLSAEDVAALESRTEGWIAGLQLAALSMQSQPDRAGFLRAFAGDHRYIMDYLVEEVLQHQPEAIRNFLLRTSILERLNAALCEAVVADGQTQVQARLEFLERSNFFLIPLDERRHWYRYHPLFGDVLRMHLIAELPDQVPVLHRRASAWYEQNGAMPDAVAHALAGKDFERAASLIERAAPAMHKIRQEATVLRWMRSLPEEIFQARPVLSILAVGALMSNGAIEGVEERLRDAERWLEIIAHRGERPGDMIVVNEEEFLRLPGAVAMYHAGMALALGNLSETVRYARRVLDLVPETDHLGRGAAAALLGLALWAGGDLEAAHRSFAEGMAQLQRAGNIADAVGGVLALADIRITQGRLQDAMRTYERALQLAKENGTLTIRGTADMYVGMSELQREYNDLDTALQLLRRALDQGEHTGFPQHPYRWRVAMARLREAQGDLEGALALLDEAEPLYVSDFFPNVHPIAAFKARVWIVQGRLEKALDWAREQGLSAEDDLSYLREFEHITLSRLLLARSRSEGSGNFIPEAIGLLERLLKAAEEGGRTGNVIEILILQALAYQMRGDHSKALTALERALRLAEPQAYVRMFVDEGEPMARLLREAARHKIMPNYTRKLLDAFPDESPRTPHLPSQPLPEPLTERELDVLKLFRTELSGPEIARELVIGLSTVRTHTKSIYSKLGVNSRRAAVKRAEELGLI